MQEIPNTVCKPIKGDSQAIHKPGEGKMYNTSKQYKKTFEHTVFFTIHLQTLEAAKPIRA